MMLARISALEPNMHHFQEKHLQPLHSAPLPQLHQHRAPEPQRLSTENGNAAIEDAYKGSWTEMEDDCLRRFTEVRNATATACDASRCRNKCIETACPHHWCREDRCQHGRCTENECLVPNYTYQRPMPEGTLVMQPLEVTLCHHLTNTEKLWTEIASLVSRTCQRKRNAKQCRERWFQQLRPGLILHLPIQPEEGDLIASLITEKGQKWAEISRHPNLQRRSDNAIKNWWNSSGNKKDRALTGRLASARSNASSPTSGTGPIAPQRISKQRPLHRPSRSDGYMSRLYGYANGPQATDFFPPEPPRVLPPIRDSSPPLHQRACSDTQSRDLPPVAAAARAPVLSAPPSYYPQPHNSSPPAQHRRRESTVSINSTSRSTSNSGPSTPMTSVSMSFGGCPAVDSRPLTSSPKDPRMSIDVLCGA
jgi:hypothetical protein